MVPVFFDAPFPELRQRLHNINGILFPGGEDIINHTPYMRTAKFIFEEALAMNAA